MTKRNQSKSLSVCYNGIGGIKKNYGHSSTSGAKDIVNFIVCKDGSLKKRCGFRMLTNVGTEIRAVHTTIKDGKFVLFVIGWDCIFRVDTEEGEHFGEKSLAGNIYTDQGEAIFFTFDGDTYIADSLYIYIYDTNTMLYTPVIGYVPLVGKDWPNNIVGPDNEPRNILNRHARITYVVSDLVSIYLCTKDIAESVEAVYLNGSRLSSDKYTIGDIFNTINVQNLSPGDRLDVYFTYKPSNNEPLSILNSSKLSAIFGGAETNRVMLCGSDGYSKIFCSKPVSRNDLADSRKIYPQSNGLYFPEGFEISIGNGAGAICSILRHHNNILIFSDSELWVASPEDDYSGKINAYSINSEIGCSNRDAAVIAGNDPVSLGRHSVWLWKNESGASKKYQAVKLSEDIDDELNMYGLENCGIFYSKVKNEIWINCRKSDVIWIYNFDSASWYKFKGITADKLFEIDGQIAFIKDNVVFIFDEKLSVDLDENGDSKDIIASFVTNQTDFNTQKKKNLLSLNISADLGGYPIDITFEGDNGILRKIEVPGGVRNRHSNINRHLYSQRFDNLTVKIESRVPANQIIHKCIVNVR